MLYFLVNDMFPFTAVEPLVCKEFLTIRPVIIPYHRGGKRLHIWVPEHDGGQAFHFSTFSEFYAIETKAKVLTVCQSGNADALDGF
ncbi:hypothetical protein Patl1_14115 [Pistacia atlantica]|uniref:Uncharacterized protein n=1 Tax=Pistacia atlantica TaxID=434234 RepID=A0ACC1AU10_9ROSI|nr:hypothetical protein Patl1_14115 [Pistacia atlantica]